MPTAEHYLPLIERAAKAFARTHRLPPWEDWEDLVSIGWKKVRREIPKREPEDVRYGVWMWCWWTFQNHLRDITLGGWRSRRGPGRRWRKDVDWRQGLVHPEVKAQAREPDPAWLAETKDTALRMLWEGNRDERTRTIVRLYYMEGLTMREIGDIWHVSESAISQALSASMERMRRAAARVCA